MSNTNYPNAVEESLTVLSDALTQSNFYGDFPSVTEDEVVEVFGPFFLKRWLDTGETTDSLTEEDEQLMNKMLAQVVAISSLNRLREEGIVDWIDDGDGNEMVFLTDTGKELTNEYFVNPELN
jgi:hypothetical protein